MSLELESFLSKLSLLLVSLSHKDWPLPFATPYMRKKIVRRSVRYLEYPQMLLSWIKTELKKEIYLYMHNCTRKYIEKF